MKKVKETNKVAWVKPKIKVEELTMRSLLGENGWMDQMRSGLVRPIYAKTLE